MVTFNNLISNPNGHPNGISEVSNQMTQSGTRVGLIKTVFIGFLLLGENVLAAKDLCQQSNMRGFCQGNLGIARRDMPQVEDDAREAYLLSKSQQGAVIQSIQIPAHKLVPIQSEINHGIVVGMVKSYLRGTFNPCQRPILVADNQTHYKIMDGHHTAMACRLLGKRQNTIVIHEKSNEVLSELQQFPGSFRRKLDDSISQPSTSEASQGTSKDIPSSSNPTELTTSQKNPKKYWVIDSPGSKTGMFGTLLTILGTIDYHNRHLETFDGLEVDFGNSGLYYDSTKGNNWWQYYFQPLQIGEKTEQVKGLTKTERWHFSNCIEHNFRGSKNQMPRTVGHEHLKKYFKIQPELQSEINDFVSEHLNGHYVIGVHYRGTDKVDSTRSEAARVSYENMLKYVSEQVKQQKPEDFRIFIATDESAFVEFMNEKFPGKVVTTDITRSTDGQPLHLKSPTPYKGGREALIDCMLLASGNVLIRTSSNLSLFATFINPHMPVIETSLRSSTEHAQEMNKIAEQEGLTEC